MRFLGRCRWSPFRRSVARHCFTDVPHKNLDGHALDRRDIAPGTRRQVEQDFEEIRRAAVSDRRYASISSN